MIQIGDKVVNIHIPEIRGTVVGIHGLFIWLDQGRFLLDLPIATKASHYRVEELYKPYSTAASEGCSVRRKESAFQHLTGIVLATNKHGVWILWGEGNRTTLDTFTHRAAEDLLEFK